MCDAVVETFTLTELLQDPLTRMAMTSDGVSEKEFGELLLRMRDTLHGRARSGADIQKRP
jgi:ribosomal protein S12 methylthiotransferase accessory factor YcaO